VGTVIYSRTDPSAAKGVISEADVAASRSGTGARRLAAVAGGDSGTAWAARAVARCCRQTPAAINQFDRRSVGTSLIRTIVASWRAFSVEIVSRLAPSRLLEI
jgi:hypothetical protein